MPEIVAAHLERVARETAEKWLGPEPYAPAMASGASWGSIPFETTFTIKPHEQLVDELTSLVAAALAACAREEHDFLCVPCANAMRAKCPSQRCGRGAALERAAGEKAAGE